MSLKSELQVWVTDVFSKNWEERDGNRVPDDESKLGFKNEAIKIEGTVLYADMADSTRLVDGYKPWFAAEMYKTFLYCAAKIVRSENGVITAYDGDRIMAVFIGDRKNTSAVRAAMKIRWAEDGVIKAKMNVHYPAATYIPSHVTGIDTSSLYVAKTGVRGANDLVWVGRAANHAAKLSALPAPYTYISAAVFKSMRDEVKFHNGQDMWEARTWKYSDSTIYRSAYRWVLPD
jgi:class 3 adenylate cyclase